MLRFCTCPSDLFPGGMKPVLPGQNTLCTPFIHSGGPFLICPLPWRSRTDKALRSLRAVGRGSCSLLPPNSSVCKFGNP
uniref:Uncharacterized protein n=1 Tax=Anguilla anguilla TaxID=7936 RepID=A0A0E9W9N9_ANGAN